MSTAPSVKYEYVLQVELEVFNSTIRLDIVPKMKLSGSVAYWIG